MNTAAAGPHHLFLVHTHAFISVLAIKWSLTCIVVFCTSCFFYVFTMVFRLGGESDTCDPPTVCAQQSLNNSPQRSALTRGSLTAADHALSALATQLFDHELHFAHEANPRACSPKMSDKPLLVLCVLGSLGRTCCSLKVLQKKTSPALCFFVVQVPES